MGIGDWGLGIGDWGLSPIPNPQKYLNQKQGKINININILVIFHAILKFHFNMLSYIYFFS